MTLCKYNHRPKLYIWMYYMIAIALIDCEEFIDFKINGYILECFKFSIHV